MQMQVGRMIGFIILLGCVSSSGCTTSAFVAGGLTGGAVVADNRSVVQKTRDQSLQQQIGNLIYKDPVLHDDTQVVIAVYNNEVLLAGQALNESLRAIAEKHAYSVHGVERVYNQMTIGKPISPWAQTKDAWLTAKVKSKLVSTADVRAAHIKVVSDNGVVYLFGKINQQHANLAAQAVSEVSGVHQVVTLFRDPSTNKGITVARVAQHDDTA